MIRYADPPLILDMDKLLILSLLHDVGAYKTEEIDKLVSFESNCVWSHSIYGYLFLKYMSPMGEASEAILYHHLNYSDYVKADSKYLDYAGLICLADRIDILNQMNSSACDLNQILKNSGTRFDPKYVKLFFDSHPERIIAALNDGSYQKRIAQIISGFSFTFDEAFEYLKMMVFSVDFRSEYTVTHTINTVAISMELGRRFGLSEEELQRLYLGSLLHDVEKVAINPEILEFQGRLTPEKMEIMKRHVVYSKEIISGVVDEEIVKIAVRHHEKLDGSGYPDGLKENELTLSQQIVAVADIISALTSKRSYKEAFPKDKALTILNQMLNTGKLSPLVCDEMINNYDAIMSITDDSRNPIIRIYDVMHTEFIKNMNIYRNTVKTPCR